MLSIRDRGDRRARGAASRQHPRAFARPPKRPSSGASFRPQTAAKQLSQEREVRMLVRLVCGAALSCAWAAGPLPGHPPATRIYEEFVAESAGAQGIPKKRAPRVIVRESGYTAKAMPRRYWGLMQITYPTAKSMG